MPGSLITDVAGLSVGHAHDTDLASGVTAIVFDDPVPCGVAVHGGAAATRDTDCLAPDASVPAVDALVLSGGSGFGLDAASGVQAWLRARGRGFAVGPVRVPIVPSAICFDLTNGGNKAWGRYPPYRELGWEAAQAAASTFALGTAGAGFGASTVNLKGGLGSASAVTSAGFTVGALVVVNALGAATIGAGPHFWAAPWERNGEFGGLGVPAKPTAADLAPAWKGQPQPATTLAVVASDARIAKAEARRLAIVAHDGLARGLRLAHAAMDGDTVFAAATGRAGPPADLAAVVELGVAAADCVARSVARAVYEATIPARWSGPPAWRDRFTGI